MSLNVPESWMKKQLRKREASNSLQLHRCSLAHDATASGDWRSSRDSLNPPSELSVRSDVP